MKTILLILLLAFTAEAATVRFEWDASTDHALVTNYCLYVSTNSTPSTTGWSQKYDALRATNVSTTMPKGGWYCWVICEGTNAISDPSNVAFVRVLNEVTIKVRF